MRRLALVLAGAIALGCGASTPTLPTFELPSFDTSAVERLVDDALAEVERAAGDVSIDLPPDLASLLEQNRIELPPLPTNASEICAAMGTPGAGTVSAAAVRSLVDGFVSGGEVGLAIGLLVTVVFTTCPIWSPHLETAVEQVLGNP